MTHHLKNERFTQQTKLSRTSTKKMKSKHTKRLKTKDDCFESKKTIHTVNEILSQCKEQINELKLPDFGSGLSDSDMFSLVYSTDDTIASLVADRFTNKFERPSKGNEQLLRDACTLDWIRFEESHLAEYANGPIGLGRIDGRSTVYRARSLIKDWLEPADYSRSFWHFATEAPINFGPGETFISSHGKVCLHEKLNKVDEWTCTADNAPMASMVIAANFGLRSLMVKWLKNHLTKEEYDKNQRQAYQAVVNQKSNVPLKVRVLAYRIYNEFFYRNGSCSDVIIYGARASSVYKNSTKRRPINIEGFLNIIVQKLIGWSLRQCLKRNAGVDLDEDQSKHRRLLKDMSLTTADFSNASESITIWLVKNLFARCPKIFKVLDRARSKFCIHHYPYVTENSSIDRQKTWFPNEKFSSMGNGFTFELLTLVILSIARVNDSNASVYGDDLICSTVSANQIMSNLREVGFVPNMKKTFINSPLRESCGGFYLDGYGYITSFDFKWCNSIPDVVVACNKLSRIVRFNENWNHELKDLLQRAHADILALFPATFCGPLVPGTDIPKWIEVPNYVKRHMDSNAAKVKWRKFEEVAELLADDWQYFHKDNITNAYSTYGWVVVDVYEIVEEELYPIQDELSSKDDMHIYMTYLHAGMRTAGLLRQKDAEYRFIKKSYLVTPHGDFIVLHDKIHADIFERRGL